MREAIVAVAIFCASYPAWANERALIETAHQIGIERSQVSKYLADCDLNQSSMNVCAQYRFIQSTFELDEVYRKLVASPEGRKTQHLVAAQKAWLTFRNQNCSYSSSDTWGGSMHAMVELNCKRELTEERIGQIRSLLSCTSFHGECSKSK